MRTLTALFTLFAIMTLIGCGESQPPIEDRIAIHLLMRHGELGIKVWQARHSNTEIYEVAKASGLYEPKELYGWQYGRIVYDLTDGAFSWFPFRHQCIGVAHSNLKRDSSPKVFFALITYCRDNNIPISNKEYRRLQKECGL